MLRSGIAGADRRAACRYTVAAGAEWVINCPGVRNVPMTADSEQSLPLQLVATLKCGEEVTLLANDEGYTARIQAADGTIGFVAAIYLKKIPATKRPPTIAVVNRKERRGTLA